MIFTDDEIETIKALIDDWGSDCPFADYKKVNELGAKLGIREPILPPTEEELARQKAFRESPTGKILTELFSMSNKYVEQIAKEVTEDCKFLNGDQWPKPLRIRLPNDLVIKK